MQALGVDIHMGLYFTAASGAFLLPPAVIFFSRIIIWLNFTAAGGGRFYGPSGAGGKIDQKSKQAPKKTYMGTGEPYIDWIPAFGAYTQKRSKLLPAVECSFSAPKKLPNFGRCSYHSV